MKNSNVKSYAEKLIRKGAGLISLTKYAKDHTAKQIFHNFNFKYYGMHVSGLCTVRCLLWRNNIPYQKVIKHNNQPNISLKAVKKYALHHSSANIAKKFNFKSVVAARAFLSNHHIKYIKYRPGERNHDKAVVRAEHIEKYIGKKSLSWIADKFHSKNARTLMFYCLRKRMPFTQVYKSYMMDQSSNHLIHVNLANDNKAQSLFKMTESRNHYKLSAKYWRKLYYRTAEKLHDDEKCNKEIAKFDN